MKDDSLFAFAGIWDRWRQPRGLEIESCAILTTTPNELLSDVHDRMPAIEVKRSVAAHLLPPYDEYMVGYKDRSALVDASHLKLLDPVRSIFAPAILINGKIVGTWKRTVEKRFVVISPSLFDRLNAGEQNALDHTAEEYGRFVGLSVLMK